MLLLLIITLSHNALGRPQADEDVKIITIPSPGQEYVAIHNGKTVIPLKQSKELDGHAEEGEYMGVWVEALGVLQHKLYISQL
jgi:hypothetical protein